MRFAAIGLGRSQLPVSRWHERIGGPTLADSILDRMVRNAHRIEMGGESMCKQRGEKEKSESCGGQRTPFEIASRFPLSHSFNNKLDDPDHFLENPSASVASLRPLIGSTQE